MKVDVSILIVHYKVKKELFACLDSIIHSKPQLAYEIIVVDNDERKTIGPALKKRFPQVIYIANAVNNGWGGGTNVATQFAKGDYLFFLNPDTLLMNDAITILFQFAEGRKHLGVAAGLLFDDDRNVYQLQGTQDLTPFRAIFALSLINKVWPNNPVSKKFWLKDKDRTSLLQVDVAPLSASLIKREIFQKLGGFDEQYFLYFEEYDLARRLRKTGFISYIVPEARIIHSWGKSSIFRHDKNEIFSRSRKYYFHKYYGDLTASFVEFFLNLPIRKLLLR